MTIAVKLLLTVALIFSIAVPFGAFAAGEKTKGRYKTALAANTVMFFGTMLFAVCVLFGGTAFAAESTAAAGGISTGMGYIAAALSTGLSCIGGGVSAAASAALGAISEDSSILGKSLIFVGLAEGVCLYGLIISFMIIGKL